MNKGKMPYSGLKTPTRLNINPHDLSHTMNPRNGLDMIQQYINLNLAREKESANESMNDL